MSGGGKTGGGSAPKVDISADFVKSVLGEPTLERQRPELRVIKSMVGTIRQYLTDWDAADLLRLLDQYLWDKDAALNAVYDGRFQKGDDWTEYNKKQKQKRKPGPKASPAKQAKSGNRAAPNARGRGGPGGEDRRPPTDDGRASSRGTSRGRGRGAATPTRGRGSGLRGGYSPAPNAAAAPRKSPAQQQPQQAAAPAPQSSKPSDKPDAPSGVPVAAAQQQQQGQAAAGSQQLQGAWAQRARHAKESSLQSKQAAKLPGGGQGKATRKGGPQAGPHPSAQPAQAGKGQPNVAKSMQPGPSSAQAQAQEAQREAQAQAAQREAQAQAQREAQAQQAAQREAQAQAAQREAQAQAQREAQAQAQREAQAQAQREAQAQAQREAQAQAAAQAQREAQAQAQREAQAQAGAPRSDERAAAQDSGQAVQADPLFIAPGLPGVDTGRYRFRFGMYGQEESQSGPAAQPPQSAAAAQAKDGGAIGMQQFHPSGVTAIGGGADAAQSAGLDRQYGALGNGVQGAAGPAKGQGQGAKGGQGGAEQVAAGSGAQGGAAAPGKSQGGVDMSGGIPHLPSGFGPPGAYYPGMYTAGPGMGPTGTGHPHSMQHMVEHFPYNTLPQDPATLGDLRLPPQRVFFDPQQLSYHHPYHTQQPVMGQGSPQPTENGHGGNARASPPIGGSYKGGEPGKYSQPQQGHGGGAAGQGQASQQGGTSQQAGGRQQQHDGGFAGLQQNGAHGHAPHQQPGARHQEQMLPPQASPQHGHPHGFPPPMYYSPNPYGVPGQYPFQGPAGINPIQRSPGYFKPSSANPGYPPHILGAEGQGSPSIPSFFNAHEQKGGQHKGGQMYSQMENGMQQDVRKNSGSFDKSPKSQGGPSSQQPPQQGGNGGSLNYPFGLQDNLVVYK
eukprot:CAMPEP_0119154996 /NCGR_PEP_ID=MMETSP1310-20130426/51522_1 /TAXON_ID=464262 /ORGANISM="Genus nov. species nov., Strain RCC2339" /LENGTH=894 /DNA_ID=CAMNT_0007147583 /DNA_START=137 /DNA_END=2821 /DNA_ORIENTATION=+